MSDNDVEVQFGATTSDLDAGVSHAKSQIGSLGESMEGLSSTLEKFAGAFGAAFSIEALVGFVEKMGELGESIERTSAMLGTTNKDTQELGYIAEVTGGSAEGMATAMERFQVSLARAQNPMSQQAQALKVFGLNAKELIGLPLPEQMNRFADAVSKFADGPEKTAAIGALNRGFVQMIPILDQGRTGMDALRSTAESTGIVLTDKTVAGLAAAERAGVTMSAAMTSLGAAIVGAFSQSLVTAANDMTAFTGDLTALVQSGGFAKAAMTALADSLAIVGTNFVSTMTVIADALSLEWNHIAEDWEAGDAKILSIQQASDNNLMMQAAKAKLALQMRGAYGADQSSNKPQAPAMDTNVSNELGAAIAQYQTMVKQADDAYAQLKQQYAGDVASHKMSVDQETQDLLAALAFRHAAEDAVYDAALSAAQGDAQKYASIQQKKTEADDKWRLEHEKIVQDALKTDAKEWDSMLQPMVSAFNSQLRSLLSGTETWAQAEKKILGDLIIQFIEAAEKMAVQKAAMGLASAVGGPSSALGSMLGGGAGAAATTANTTALGTLTPAILANTSALLGETTATTAEATATTAGAAAGGAGGMLGGLKSLFSMFAIPGFAIGSDMITKSGLAMIHEGESITPATARGDPFTGGAGGKGGNSGGDVHLNISAMDSRDVGQFFESNDGAMLKAINKAVKRGAHLGMRGSR